MQADATSNGMASTCVARSESPARRASHLFGLLVLAVVALSMTVPVLASPASASTPAALTNGQRIGVGGVLVSPDGQYELVLQSDGNLVTYDLAGGARATWSTGTHNGDFLVMQSDGNLVLYAANSSPVWASGTGGMPGGGTTSTYLTIQDDGNLVTYGPTGPTWSSFGGRGNPPAVPCSSNGSPSGQSASLGNGQSIGVGGVLVSPDGQYELVLQSDGNLVAYNMACGVNPIWSTGTHNGDFLVMQSDGNLVLYAANSSPVWASGTGGMPAGGTTSTYLTIQDDGNLVTYGPTGATWSSMGGRGNPPSILADGCAGNLANEIASTDGASQLITVEVSGYGATGATVTAWQKTNSCWSIAFGPYSGAVGYNGISTNKLEGDGTTPAGLYGFESTMYGNAPNPGVRYAYHQLVCGDWWDEDSSSPTYNTFEHVGCNSNPAFNNGSSEALWTETAPYPSFAVINYNPSNIPGLGSAIFLHAYTGGATAGCVSIPLADLDQVLDWMNPANSPVIDIGTTATIASY